MNEPNETSSDQRAAEARRIKAERDRQQRAGEDRRRVEAGQAEERHRAEEAVAARQREERIAAGVLGVCPHCKNEVETAEGIVLAHPDYSISKVDRTASPCPGTGEQPYQEEPHREPRSW